MHHRKREEDELKMTKEERRRRWEIEQEENRQRDVFMQQLAEALRLQLKRENLRYDNSDFIQFKIILG